MSERERVADIIAEAINRRIAEGGSFSARDLHRAAADAILSDREAREGEMREALTFLIDRVMVLQATIEEQPAENKSAALIFSDFHGHVTPALARARALTEDRT